MPAYPDFSKARHDYDELRPRPRASIGQLLSR